MVSGLPGRGCDVGNVSSERSMMKSSTPKRDGRMLVP